MRLDGFGKWARRTSPLLLLAALATPVAAQQQKKSAAEQPPLRLLLNVPENRLYVYENGVRTHKFRIAVGLPGYETPAGNYTVREVIWNPWWHPPESDWARGRKVEAPGPDNPMGRVKLNFSELLYIHGTPELQSLGRATSRGCVRMSNDDVIALTRIVHRYASPGVAAELLERLERNPRETHKVPLKAAVPFKVVYNVAAVANGFLHLYPDLYGLVGDDYEDQVWSVLEDNGIGPRDVDQRKLDRLLSKGPTKKVAMSLDTLLSVGAAVSTTSHR
jgi:murein L,D-transpeptidase YcbB/YkuD